MPLPYPIIDAAYPSLARRACTYAAYHSRALRACIDAADTWSLCFKLVVALLVAQRLDHGEQLFVRHESSVVLELVLIDGSANFCRLG